MRVFSVFLAFMFSAAAQAVVVSDLYQVPIAVENQSTEHYQHALQEALQQVFVKVSGSISTLQNEQIQQASQQPQRFLRSYRYQQQADQLQALFQFSEHLIDAALRDAGEPIWGRSRPLVLLWQGTEENNRRIVLSQEATPLQQILERNFNARGIPVLWPAQDLEDQMNLPVGHLWGLFRGDIAKASQRYLTDAFIAGKLLRQLDQSWRYQGYLQLQEEILELDSQALELETLLHEVADQVASFLARHYAVTSDQLIGGQYITVTGIRDFNQYKQLQAYLSANVAIQQVQVVAINEQHLTLALEHSGEWDKVWQNLSFDKRLIATDEPLVYHWQY